METKNVSVQTGDTDVADIHDDLSTTLTDQINKERLRQTAIKNPHYLETRKIVFDTLVKNLSARYVEFVISKDQLVQCFFCPEFMTSYDELKAANEEVQSDELENEFNENPKLFWTFSQDSKWKETIFLLWKIDKCLTSLHSRTSDKDEWMSIKTTTGWLNDSKEIEVFYGNILDAKSTQFKLRISPYKLQQSHINGMISVNITDKVLWREGKSDLFMNTQISIPNTDDDTFFWFDSNPSKDSHPLPQTRPLWYESTTGPTDLTSDINLIKRYFPTKRNVSLLNTSVESSTSNMSSVSTPLPSTLTQESSVEKSVESLSPSTTTTAAAAAVAAVMTNA